MVEWKPDESFLEYVTERLQYSVQKGTPVLGHEGKFYTVPDIVNEMRRGTEFGRQYYGIMQKVYGREFEDVEERL